MTHESQGIEAAPSDARSAEDDAVGMKDARGRVDVVTSGAEAGGGDYREGAVGPLPDDWREEMMFDYLAIVACDADKDVRVEKMRLFGHGVNATIETERKVRQLILDDWSKAETAEIFQQMRADKAVSELAFAHETNRNLQACIIGEAAAAASFKLVQGPTEVYIVCKHCGNWDVDSAYIAHKKSCKLHRPSREGATNTASVSAEREAHEGYQDTGAITRPLASPSSTGHEVTSAPEAE